MARDARKAHSAAGLWRGSSSAPAGPSDMRLPVPLFQQGRPPLIVPETHVLFPTVGLYAPDSPWFRPVGCGFESRHQMGQVRSTWLLVQCLDRPNKARGPKGVRTTLGMLGSWPGSNTGRFPWGHCTGLPWDRGAPAALSGLRNPAPLPPSPVDAVPPRAARIWGLAWILPTQTAHEHLLVSRRYTGARANGNNSTFSPLLPPSQPTLSWSHYCLRFTIYPRSPFSWPLFTLTYHWICLGRCKYPPQSILQFAFSCFPDVLELFPHQFLYVCPIHFNGCLIATRQTYGGLPTPPPTLEH